MQQRQQRKRASTGTIPTEGQIYISEIMVAGGGTLPQWIEIANGSKSEENLSGWTLTIANAAADADVSIGAYSEVHHPRWHDDRCVRSAEQRVHDLSCHRSGS